MRRIAMEQKGEEGDDDAEIVEEPEEEEEPPEEAHSEGLKQVVRGGPYSMCTRAGLGRDFTSLLAPFYSVSCGHDGSTTDDVYVCTNPLFLNNTPTWGAIELYCNDNASLCNKQNECFLGILFNL